MRIRTSHKPDGWRDLGPCPDVRTTAGSATIQAQPVGHMEQTVEWSAILGTTRLRAVPDFKGERFNGPIAK